MALAAITNDDEMSGDRRYPTQTELALIRKELEEIRRILHGRGGQKGLVTKVDDLTEVSERGRWSLKIALWLGGAIVGLLTLAAQLKGLIFGGTPPGH